MSGSVISISEIRTLILLLVSVAGTSKQKRMCECVRRNGVMFVQKVVKMRALFQTSLRMRGRNRRGHACSPSFFTQ